MKIVVALGGNALGNTPLEQKEIVKNTAKSIVDLIKEGHQLVVVHGNGPQVGIINLSFETANSNNSSIPLMPFPECGSMSQGYIGYHLQNAIKNELYLQNIKKDVVTLVTQVEVSLDDPSFSNPTKPIGKFYSKEEADKLAKEKGWNIVSDANRGYRRVVPSPKPIDIVEKDTISKLIDTNTVVIACGGGGIPVYQKENLYYGVDAVIDKDFASSKLASLINADALIILTAVDRVAINYGKETQENLDVINLEKVNQYIKEGHFAPGSMLPKIIATSQFVESGKNKTAIIGSLDRIKDVLDGTSGTKIVS